VTGSPPERFIRLKRIVVGAGVGLAAALTLALLGAATMVTVAATTGADLEETFTAAPRVPVEIDALVGWDQDAAPLLRSVEPDTRDDVAATWVGALASIDSAIAGETTAMETWFTGGALSGVRAQTSADSAVTGPRWLDHRASVRFYSLDGRILGLTIESRGVLDVDGTVVDVDDSHEVVAVLQDGYWRIATLDTDRTS
jgi:hypothetical protein